MSMHESVIAIKGNHLTELADVFKQCEYEIEEQFTVQSCDDALNELD